MIAALLFAAFVVLMLAGVPIGAAMGLAGAACIALANAEVQWFGLLAVPQNFYAGLGKYPLLAIPMFVLVGSIFDRSSVALRLVNLAIAIVGRGPGMLPLVAIGVAMFLGGISGSGPATAAAVGGVMLAAMARAGYPAAYSASVVGAAAATDILIPPSIAFIVYSVLVPGASVPALFAAGVLPGLLVGLALMAPAWWLARRHGMGVQEAGLPRPPFWLSLREAAWGLIAPVLILGGMRAGWFTPTEASVVAVFYALVCGKWIYRTLSWGALPDILARSALLTASVLIIIGLSASFAWVLTIEGLPQQLAEWMAAQNFSVVGFLLAVNVFLLLFGIFIEPLPGVMVLVPILAPVAAKVGVEPVHFAMVVIFNLTLGMITPPVGGLLFVTSNVSRVPLAALVRELKPFLWAHGVILLIITFIPALSTWLPHQLGFK